MSTLGEGEQRRGLFHDAEGNHRSSPPRHGAPDRQKWRAEMVAHLEEHRRRLGGDSPWGMGAHQPGWLRTAQTESTRRLPPHGEQGDG
jgi:hypothetical protein